MSEKPEWQSRDSQNEASETGNPGIQPPTDIRVTSVTSGFLPRAAARFRSLIFGPLPFLAGMSPRVSAGVAGILILFATASEWRKASPPINSPSPRVLGWTWWTTPHQLNAERTLPAFDNATIESVEIVPNGNRVWIAGDAGLLAFSDDEGANWTTFHYEADSGTMVKDAPVASLFRAPTWHVEAAQSQARQQPNTQSQLPAQANSAAIRGTVTEVTGAIIPGAQLTLTNVSTKYASTSLSGKDGTYAFPNLPPGEYVLGASLKGFKSYQQSGIILQANQDFVANVVLRVGAVTETVTVTGESLPLVRDQVRATVQSKKPLPQPLPPKDLTLQAPPRDPPNWNSIAFSENDKKMVYLQSRAGLNSSYGLYSQDAGITWTPRQPQNWQPIPLSAPKGTSLTRSSIAKAEQNVQFSGFARVSLTQEWAVGNDTNLGPVIYHTYKYPDKVESTQQYPSAEDLYPKWRGTKFSLNSVSFRADSKIGFAAGTQGAILRTRDGGQHWEPITRGAAAPGTPASAYPWWRQPVRVPAPLSLLFFLFGFVLLVPALMPEAVPRVPAERTIANLAVSDAPVFLSEKDELGFTPVARAIAGLLRNKATGLPLTVAINAPWGRGKTSLMSLVQQELKASGWRTVWFNAWHHQEETSMLASLLQTVRHKAPPELFMRGGVRYRVRLLAKRLWRWRTLWILAAVVALFLSEKVVHDHNPQIYRNGAQYVYNIVSGSAIGGEKSESSKGNEKPGVLQVAAKMLLDLTADSGNTGEGHLIPLFVLLLLLFLLVVQILQSFGANPAELLAKTSDRRTVAGLEAQTSFLEKFRDQYGEVVEALGKYRLAIFVDDLDRCRPDKIAETLEAANYLMAAGPCALVLALEEQAVIVGLGLSFQRMAEEIGKLPEDRKRAPGDLLAEAREKRQSFAKNYVEKLFNVVVQTPPVVADSLAQLLAGRPRLQEKLRKMEQQRRRKAQLQDLVRVPAAAAILGMLFLGGYSFLRALLPPTETLTASQQLPQMNAPAASGGNLASPSPKGVDVTAATEATPVIVPTYAAAKIPLPSAWFETWWQRLVWGLVALSILVPLSLRRPPPLIADSTDFTEALVTWAPVLAARNPSPRFAKRVLNRLRYLSMLERQAEEQSRIAAAVSANAQPERIPETLLVAFGTLEAVAPEYLASQSAFSSFRNLAWRSGSRAYDGVADLAWNTLSKHTNRFGNITDSQLNEFRQRYVELSQGIVAR